MADLNTKKINFTASQVEKAINFALTQVAVPFSTSETYAVDDFVVYEGLLYQCISAVTTAGAWDSTKWQVRKIFDNNGYVIINGGEAPSPIPNYLCFTANTAGSTIKCPSAFEYSSDRQNWSIASTSTAITLTNAGDKIYLRNGSVGTPTSALGTFEMSGSIAASGNIMSLVDNTCESLTIPCDGCYDGMFYNCTSLTTAPALPATVLTEGCYSGIFSGCTSLTTAPALPAVAITRNCYQYMFNGCTSLYVSDTSVSGTCDKAWTIPTSDTFTNTFSQKNMFTGCLGIRSSNNMAGAQGQSYTYYTQNTPV